MFNHLNINQYQTRRSIQNIHQSISSPPITVSLPSTHTLSLFTLSYTHIYIISLRHVSSHTQTNKQNSLSLSLSLHLFLTISALPFCLDFSIYRYLFITNFARPSLSLSLLFFFFFFFPWTNQYIDDFPCFWFWFWFSFSSCFAC